MLSVTRLDNPLHVCIPQPDPELTRPSGGWPTLVCLGAVDYLPQCLHMYVNIYANIC